MADTRPTTAGILRETVEAAMEYLGIHNPKPEIPLELTLSGHEIVAVARRFDELDRRINNLEVEREKYDIRFRPSKMS